MKESARPTESGDPARHGVRTGARLDRRLVTLAMVVVLGTLLTTFNGTSMNVAVRTLGAEFGVSISTIQWILTGYFLAFAAVVPVTGWAGERFGAKRVWLGGVVLFVVASALSGASWSAGALITFRILEGVAAGVVVPVGQAILARAAGADRMGRAISLLSVPILLGSVAGPVFGGLIISTLGWRWIFYVDVPIGVLAYLVGRKMLPETEPRPATPIDLRGIVLLCGGVASFIYGLNEVSAAGTGGTAGVTVGLAGATLLLLYLWHARARAGRAVIDLALFSNRGFATGIAAHLTLSITRAGLLAFLPLYWQVVHGASPLAAGLLVAPQALGAVVAMPLAGRITDRFGARVVVPAGILLVLAGTAAYAQASMPVSYPALIGAAFVIGLGVGSTAAPSVASAYGALPQDAMPRGSSAINTGQRLGASIGTAVLAIVVQGAITTRLPGLGEAVLRPLPAATRAQIEPALASAFGLTFWVAFALTAVALVPALMLPYKGKA
ncbi:MAG: DHA2 family efflux MFS transporter permease subunit [Streptosporangiales bacterium]|nr:DHA2 family efflux MFS transporter permease subunit [Streptosporangiales bacterium]